MDYTIDDYAFGITVTVISGLLLWAIKKVIEWIRDLSANVKDSNRRLKELERDFREMERKFEDSFRGR